VRIDFWLPAVNQRVFIPFRVSQMMRSGELQY
jgi:hypothetical protein